MPNRLVREQVEANWALRPPREPAWVGTWDEFWAEARRHHARGVTLLPPAGQRAVLVEAIERARRDGRMRALGDLAGTAGFRRTLGRRFQAWAALGRRPDGAIPTGVSADEWAVYAIYRALLKRLDADDDAGFALQAAGWLKTDLPRWLGPSADVTVVDPPPCRLAVRRALEALHESAGTLRILLTAETDLDRREVYADVDGLREWFHELGIRSVVDPLDDLPPRPVGLEALGRRLFRLDAASPEPDARGLSVAGAPQGEGVALLVARTVLDRLEAGADPDTILVVVPQWTEQADTLVATLHAWGIAAAGGPVEPPASDPAVAALLAAIDLPAQGWESRALRHLLRNGRLQPDWPEAQAPQALARAAATIRETRVFRGLSAIEQALRQQAQPGTSSDPERSDWRARRRQQRAEQALAIVRHLSDALTNLGTAVPWAVQVAKLRALADGLGLGQGDAAALEHLWAALEDHGAVLDGLGESDAAVYWSDFRREVLGIARELAPEPLPPPPGTVRVVTAGEAAGVSAAHLVLAGLEEGTFPSRDAVVLDPAAEADDESGIDPQQAAFARELRRFLAVVLAAGESLTLVVPTTDEKGQELLPAGFVDDVRLRFTPEAWDACRTEVRRFDPILPAPLAIAPAEARVRAVGLACLDGDLTSLNDLARQPAQRPVLDGVAAALRLSQRRHRRKPYGAHEGLLTDPAIVADLASSFGPGRTVFSASQLETLAECPYKFFLRHVIRLAVPEEREEFDEDWLLRGHTTHQALEELHKLIRDVPEPDASIVERVRDNIEPALQARIATMPAPTSDVDAGLRRIDADRLLRTGQRYVQQFAQYLEPRRGQDRLDVECFDFEVEFGKEKARYEGLQLGGPEVGVGLQGMIDRIDVVRHQGQTYFRVIDYKTGDGASAADVESGLALQLPLYALAVRDVILRGQPAELLDAAYWELRGKGFKSVLTMYEPKGGSLVPRGNWPALIERVEAFVGALVDRLRRGQFPVAPRREDCTRSCEFQHVCRIQPIRHVGKLWPEAPRMEPSR